MNTSLESLALIGLGGGEIILIMILLLILAVVAGGIIGAVYLIVRISSRPPPVSPLPLPPRIVTQIPQKRDDEHLNLLSIFHFVFAGLALVGIASLYFNYLAIQTFFSNPKFWNGPKGPVPPPKEVLDIMIWFYLFIGLAMLAGLALNATSGFFLRQRRHRLFSFIVAALNCIQVPFGTVLGVLTNTRAFPGKRAGIVLGQCHEQHTMKPSMGRTLRPFSGRIAALRGGLFALPGKRQ